MPRKLCAAIAIVAITGCQETAPQRTDLKDEFLLSHLPTQFTDLDVKLENSSGETDSAFPPLEGRNVGPAELQQIDAIVELSTSLAFARGTMPDTSWKRLGVVSVIGENGAKARVEIYQTAGGILGFKVGEHAYRCDRPMSAILQRQLRISDL